MAIRPTANPVTYFLAGPKVRGAPVKQATFSAVWEEQERQQGKAQNVWLAVKVLDGLAGKSKKDGVHLYIDGRHNREVTYDSDDTHVFLSRDELKPYGPIKRHIRGRPDWFIEGRVTEIDGGYVMEICVGSTYFIGEGNPIDFGAKSVYGFDLAVEEEAGCTAWRGNEKIDEDTGRRTAPAASNADGRIADRGRPHCLGEG